MKSIFYSLISKLGFALIKLAAKGKTRDKCDYQATMNCETIQNLTFIYLTGKDSEVEANLKEWLTQHNSQGDDSVQLIATREVLEND